MPFLYTYSQRPAEKSEACNAQPGVKEPPAIHYQNISSVSYVFNLCSPVSSTSISSFLQIRNLRAKVVQQLFQGHPVREQQDRLPAQYCAKILSTTSQDLPSGLISVPYLSASPFMEF